MREFNLQHSKTKSEQILSPGTPVLLAVFLKKSQPKLKMELRSENVTQGPLTQDRVSFCLQQGPLSWGDFTAVCLSFLPKVFWQAWQEAVVSWGALCFCNMASPHWSWPALPFSSPSCLSAPSASLSVFSGTHLPIQRARPPAGFFGQLFVLWPYYILSMDSLPSLGFVIVLVARGWGLERWLSR